MLCRVPESTFPRLPNDPTPSSPAVSARMSRQSSRDTGPERALRRALFAAGLRYRVHHLVSLRPRRHADIAFTRAKVAVFVDGCYWHGCPAHGTSPKANSEWWKAKIERNRLRDRDTDERLMAEGWLAARVWEHENPIEAAAKIAALVRRRRSSSL